MLISRDGHTLDGLPRGARIGTSSLRRQAQVAGIRPDAALVDLRGNVPTRLDKVAAGEVDAALLAYAGLRRLGLESRVAEIFDVGRIVPAPGQGALAVQTRAGDDRLAALLRPLADEKTWLETTAERALLGHLEGGCQVPVGAHATLDATGAFHLIGLVASLDGSAIGAPRHPHAGGHSRRRASLWRGSGEDAARRRRSGDPVGDSADAPLARGAGGDGTMKNRALVANTRNEPPGGPLASALRARGLESLHCPTVAYEPPEDPGELADALGALERIDWVIFTSAHAVDATCSQAAVARVCGGRRAASPGGRRASHRPPPRRARVSGGHRP